MCGSVAASPGVVLHTQSGQEFTALVLEVFRFNGRLLSAGDRLAKPLQLTSARWQVLGAIEDSPLSVARIARNMGLTRQSVQRLSDRLEQEGFVEYEPNPQHRRAKLVRLTQKGTTLMGEIWKRQTEWANRVTAEISAHEIQAALTVIRKLRLKLEDP